MKAVAEVEARLSAATGRERLELLVELSEIHRPRDAVTSAEEGMALLVDHPDPHLELRLTLRLLYAFASRRELPAALEMGARAEKLARRLNETKALGRALRRQGDVYRYSSDLEQAMRFYNEAVRYSEQAGDQINLGQVHNNRAQVQIMLGRHAESLASLLSAREAFTASGDLGGVGTTLVNLGLEYKKRGEDETAMDYYEQALRMARLGGAGSSKLRGHTLGTMATLHLERGEPLRARELLLEALKWFRRAGNPKPIAWTHSNLSDVQLALGELDQAAVQTGHAIALAEEIDDLELLLVNRQRLAQIHNQRGDRAAAIRELENAEQRARQLRRDDQLDGILLDLSVLYAASGRFEQAYSAFREHEKLKSRGHDEQGRRALAEMRAELDLERRENELEQMRSQQSLQAIELRRQTDRQRGLLAGFGLMLALLGLAFNRYRHEMLADRLRESMAQTEAVNDRLRAIDKLKDDFLAATSHELRTPLYGITGLAEALIDGVAGELSVEAKTNLSMIVSSGRRLARLVDDILDFSKLRRDSLVLDRRPVELHALVDIVLTLSRPLVADKQLELMNAVASDLPPVLADENRVQQILHNLVGNAIKFTDGGRVEVSARADDDWLVIEVADTGIGIEQEHCERIFAAFEQAEGSTDRRFGGTGLGLAVSRRLVGLHGGKLWLKSTSDAGSIFAFTLPVTGEQIVSQPAIEASAVEEPRGEPIEADGPKSADWFAEASGIPEGRHKNILVVDDEPINRQVLASQLKAAGYHIALAADGPEALRRLDERCFDLVLLDVMMPRMSGFEVCRELRERFPAHDLPVLFLTAKARQEEQLTGLAEGANDYLIKPVPRDTLLARVRIHVELLEAHRKQLAGLVPICAECKKIRDDEGYWEQIETFLAGRTDLMFSHSLCPSCLEVTLAEIKAVKGDELRHRLPS